MIKKIPNREQYRLWLSRFDGEGENDGTNGNDGNNGNNQGDDGNNSTNNQGDDGNKRQYDDAEVDRIVAKHKAKWEKEQKEAIENAVKDAQEEAKKLAKMNAEQKAKYEQEKRDREIEAIKKENEELKQQALKAELSKQASRQMKEDHEIIATQDMLDFVVGSDAETTNENIKKLVGIILDDRKEQEKKRATGRTPKQYGNNGNKTNAYEAVMAKYK